MDVDPLVWQVVRLRLEMIETCAAGVWEMAPQLLADDEMRRAITTITDQARILWRAILAIEKGMEIPPELFELPD